MRINIEIDLQDGEEPHHLGAEWPNSEPPTDEHLRSVFALYGQAAVQFRQQKEGTGAYAPTALPPSLSVRL